MMRPLAAILAALLLLGGPAAAHRLDEYLQATLIAVGKDHIRASLRLAPGIAVFPTVLRTIDTDSDGALSEAEQRVYARRVLSDLSLSVDGQPLMLGLVSVAFPSLDEMKEGLGEIRIELAADLPPGGAERRLIFENHHQSGISAYLVNCLTPQDPGVRIGAQKRNETQSSLRLDYSLAAQAFGAKQLAE